MVIFHEKEVAINLKKIFEKSCEKINERDEITEYFCPCGYIVASDQKDALNVISRTCGF